MIDLAVGQIWRIRRYPDHLVRVLAISGQGTLRMAAVRRSVEEHGLWKPAKGCRVAWAYAHNFAPGRTYEFHSDGGGLSK